MMRTATPLWRTAVTAVIVLGFGVATDAALAQPVAATASCEWGPNYGAAAAGDVVAHENANYWQTVEGTALVRRLLAPTPEGSFAERIDGQRNGQAWKLVPNGLGGQQLAFVSQRADIAARTSGACKHWNDQISPFTRRASA
jgi:hypothetical protein